MSANSASTRLPPLGYHRGMARKAPLVNEHMTRRPVELDRRDSVQKAAQTMEEHAFHHLPIMDGAKLYGVVSSRDIDVVATVVGDVGTIEVGDVCSLGPLTVPPTMPVDEVAAAMLKRGVGSAVVVDARVVVGVFTVHDALRVLSEAYGG